MMFRDLLRYWPFLVIFSFAAFTLLAYDPKVYVIAIIHLFAIPALMYPLVYRHSPWKNGSTGRALMNKARAVALLYVVIIVHFWYPFPGNGYVWAVVFTYLGFAILYQLLVMFRLKHHTDPMGQT